MDAFTYKIYQDMIIVKGKVKCKRNKILYSQCETGLQNF